MVGSNVLKALRHFFAPPYCVHCRLFLSEDTVFCTPCMKLVKPLVSLPLQMTEKTSISVYALGAYEEPLRSLITSKMYGNRVASVQLATLLWQRSELRYIDFDYIVPVPLHWTRYARRWYNQAQVMAEVIAYQSGKPVADIVRRSRMTEFQVGKMAPERIDNVKGAFSLKVSAQRDQYAGKTFLIVDDVLTTGSTVKAVAQALKALKPAAIKVVVAARVR